MGHYKINKMFNLPTLLRTSFNDHVKRPSEAHLNNALFVARIEGASWSTTSCNATPYSDISHTRSQCVALVLEKQANATTQDTTITKEQVLLISYIVEGR